MDSGTAVQRTAMGHTHYMGLSGTALRTAIGLTAGLCFVAFGYGQGDLGGLMLDGSFQHEFGPMFKSGAIAGSVIATWNLGCFIGAMLTVFVGDLLGRKNTITMGLCIMTIGKLVQVTSFSIGQYVAGRFLAGFGNGFIASTVPAWQAECLKTHRRGTLLLVSFGSCISLGLAIAFWIDYAFSWVEPSSASWRVPLAFGMIFMVLPLAMIVCLPESPRYLILTGKEHEAKRVLSALNEISPEDQDIHREFLMIKNTLLHMVSAGFVEAFKQGEYRYLQRTVLAVVLQMMQQFTGVNIFMQYLATMFNQQLFFKPKLALLLAGACSTEFFLASLVAVVGIDRFWGRRTLTMFGASAMGVCMIILSVMAYLGTQTTHHVMAGILFLYLAFFSIGWQGMSWLWAVELIPLSIRGPANALSTAANWLANFIVVLCTPVMFGNITWRTYVIYAVFNFCIVPTIFFFYPETGYRSLEEVDIIFAEANRLGNPWTSVVEAARHEPLWFDRYGRQSNNDGMTSETGKNTDFTSDSSTSGGAGAKKAAHYYRERTLSSMSAESDGVPVLSNAAEMVPLDYTRDRRPSEESTALPPPSFNRPRGV